MTRETYDYIAAQVAAWHRDRKAKHNLTLHEDRLRGALVVADAEERLSRATPYMPHVGGEP